MKRLVTQNTGLPRPAQQCGDADHSDGEIHGALSLPSGLLIPEIHKMNFWDKQATKHLNLV
jgi:hypothetical protein